MMLNAEQYLLSQKQKPQEPFKLGKIDPNYTSGRPRILFDGETVVSSKRYPYGEHINLTANARVLLAEVAGSYVVVMVIK